MTQKIKAKHEFIKSMPKNHQTHLKVYKKHLDDQRVCIEHNAEIINLIIEDVENMFENAQHEVVSMFLVLLSY